MSLKSKIRDFVPEPVLLGYHLLRAKLAALLYRHPSRAMVIVGVTGTKGKTSVANFTWAALTEAGYKTGLIGTANIRVGNDEKLNHYHMTMPSPFVLQKLLARIRRAGCTHAIVETRSEAIKLFRHIGIDYDIAVFTNLTPEHLPSHGGSFENYKKTKGVLFASLKNSRRKNIGGRAIEKIIIANADSPEHGYFMNFWADKKITYSVAGDIQLNLALPGKFNISNAFAAVAVARALGISDDVARKGVENLHIIPGRMEEIAEGQAFRVFVDYAHEKESMTAVLKTANEIKKENARVIVLLGAEGGGRDKQKRPVMGAIAAQFADFVIVSSVDPYDDNPKEILEDIARAAENGGKVRDENLFVIEDRRDGIKKALELARTGDIALITGKGAEQSMIIGSRKIPWDDRAVVRDELCKLVNARQAF